MSEKIVISVKPAGGEPLNGLGMMMLQYLEQNFQDFETKRRQALSLNSSITVEADKGIAVTVTFGGREIQIQNGTSPQVDLHLQGSFIDLSKILTGRSSPLKELLTRRGPESRSNV